MTKSPSDPKQADSIDENLRRVYQQVLEEDVPDRFRSLLDKLKEQDDKPSGNQGSDI